MKQVIQSYRTGKLRVAEVPAPGVEPGAVLVATAASLVSYGTEKMVVDLAKKSLLGKARDRPDLVKKAIQRIGRDGVAATVAAMRSKLEQPIPLGYSSVGTVVAVGDGVVGIDVGARVACAGAKVANHAEVNLVPRNLCALVPDGVPDEVAAFVTVGAIALQGVRIAGVAPGSSARNDDNVVLTVGFGDGTWATLAAVSRATFAALESLREGVGEGLRPSHPDPLRLRQVRATEATLA
jgi:NADPH:quinone reductase-like Zn-dependent oxidoreductase